MTDQQLLDGALTAEPSGEPASDGGPVELAVVDHSGDDKDCRVGLSADEVQIREFVSLIGLPLLVLGIDSTDAGRPLVACTCDTADEVVSHACEWNAKRRNIYWLPNRATVRDKKPSKHEIAAARYVWADCDPDIRAYGSYRAARNHLLTTCAAKLAPVASFVIDSGNGLQAFFELAVEFPIFADGDYDEYHAINARVGAKFEGPGTYDCGRIMRLPGTLNWPTAAKLKKGYPQQPRMSRLLHRSDRTYPFEQLEHLLALGESSGTPRSRPMTAVPSDVDMAKQPERFEALLKSDGKLRARWNGGTEGLIDTTGSAMDMSLYGMLVARGFAHEPIVEIMADWPHGGQGREQGDRYWTRLKERTTATPRTPTAMDDAVARLNERFALAMVGGSAVVLDEASSPVNFLKPDAFKLLLANQAIDVPMANGDTKSQPVANVCLKHPERRTYTGVEFAPAGGNPQGTYNLFRGWAVQPYVDMSLEEAALKCGLLLTHIKQNLCRGDERASDYLIRWYAHLFQFPGDKPGVAVAIRGEKGVGKSKVTDAIAALLGPHAVTVSQRLHLTGQFNAHQAQALLIVAEEAVWAGDRQAVDGST
ncbi:DUF5906 domain-containing protein [Paraburkholderia sp. BR14374]|uniref:DUF5906 domain-containing protein n=1 Tax=Paraburkholderia sp. BR14374 TaxID=3237007 RepID=UPI0034CDE629